MQDDMQQICGTVVNITFQNEENGFAVLNLSDEDGDLVCAVGSLAGSVPGEELTLLGRFIEHSAYGRQFEAAACVHKMPESETAIRTYLSSGVLPGIGPVTARRIVDKFGEESLEILATEPERLTEVQGISLAKAREAGKRFLEIFGVREAITALGRLGLSASEALEVHRHFGGVTLEVISRNPYLLCGFPLYMNFGRVDEMAKSLSLEEESRERVRAALLYTLRHNIQNGHTCLPKEKLFATASPFFRITPEILEEELYEMEAVGQLQIIPAHDKEYVYLPDALRAEMKAAQAIRQMLAMPAREVRGLEKKIARQEIASGLKYAPLQKKAITEALQQDVLVVTGGPGTGKTTIVNAIIELFEEQADRVLLAAPTGRAAKRLSELTGRNASTIHRLLEVSYAPGSEFPRFGRHAQNPLKCDVVIVDEMSMVDAMLFESLLDAMRMGCRLIMVGDTDQLPSVGPGNVLKGVIDSGIVPVVHLTEIFRQAAASLIVSNAHRIVEGQMPEKGGKEDDYFFIRSYGLACQKLVCDLIAERLPSTYGYSSAQDIQVLCPGRKGPLGTEALNARLQEELNPPSVHKPEIRWGGVAYRLGDKVMQVKNNYDIPYTNVEGEPGAGAFNGDIGFIEEVDPSSGALTVFCEDRHVYYTQENLRELEPAYAITIHKSQGNEFDAIIMPLAEAPKKLRYRNLLYTGITRAKKLCVLAGEEEILHEMVRNGKRNTRFSCFAYFLQDDSLL